MKRLLDFMFDGKNKRNREVMAVQSMDALKLHRASGRESLGGNNRGDVSMGNVGDQDDGDDTMINPTATQAQNQTSIPGQASSITIKQAEELLDNLVAEGWLDLSSAKFYSLTPRALMELGGWLENTYNDPDAEDGEWQKIKKCFACKEIITYVSHHLLSLINNPFPLSISFTTEISITPTPFKLL